MSKQSGQVEADASCFVCGPENPIGLQVDFQTDLQAGTSFASLQLSANYQGWQDVVHGGVIAALLDEACIYACRTKAEQCVTAELQIRYRKPVPVGAQIVLTGQLLERHRKVWQAEAQLKIDDALYAEAAAKVFVLNQ
jgi:uncharacterized protein (TIGR00369 family)